MKRDPFKICKLCFGLWKQKYLFMSILKNGLNVDRYVVEVLTKTHRSKYKQPQRHFLCNFNLLKNVSNSLYWHHIITCSKCLRISFATQISTLFGDFKIQLFFFWILFMCVAFWENKMMTVSRDLVKLTEKSSRYLVRMIGLFSGVHVC